MNVMATREGRHRCLIYSPLYRSGGNDMVEVVDFDNESHTYEVDARSEQEASDLAADMAMAEGLQVNYCNVYLYVDSF